MQDANYQVVCRQPHCNWSSHGPALRKKLGLAYVPALTIKGLVNDVFPCTYGHGGLVVSAKLDLVVVSDNVKNKLEMYSIPPKLAGDTWLHLWEAQVPFHRFCSSLQRPDPCPLKFFRQE